LYYWPGSFFFHKNSYTIQRVESGRPQWDRHVGPRDPPGLCDLVWFMIFFGCRKRIARTRPTSSFSSCRPPASPSRYSSASSATSLLVSRFLRPHPTHVEVMLCHLVALPSSSMINSEKFFRQPLNLNSVIYVIVRSSTPSTTTAVILSDAYTLPCGLGYTGRHEAHFFFAWHKIF
jgi:hypothetical protein